uniref:Uncharacterized protein n=1 Tax=Rhizophora mucronata TaxID=61149 RepID=A0A2P2R3S1_RHIMU
MQIQNLTRHCFCVARQPQKTPRSKDSMFNVIKYSTLSKE